MALAAYDLSQPGSSTLSAPFCVMTSLPHCNRNAGSCTDGYTTASGNRTRLKLKRTKRQGNKERLLTTTKPIREVCVSTVGALYQEYKCRAVAGTSIKKRLKPMPYKRSHNFEVLSSSQEPTGLAGNQAS